MKLDFGTKQEREIAREIIDDIEKWAEEEMVMFLEDKEIDERIGEYMIDLEEETNDDFEDEDYDETTESIQKIVYRMLEKMEKKEVRNGRSVFGGEKMSIRRVMDGFLITVFKNDEYFLVLRGDFTKYYDPISERLLNNCPFRMRDGVIMEVSKEGILISKGSNFYLDYPEFDIAFSKTEVLHYTLDSVC